MVGGWTRIAVAGRARPSNSGDGGIELAEVTLCPWRRSGHDRLYADTHGHTLRFVDRATGGIHGGNAAARQAIADVYRTYTGCQA